MGTQEWSTEWSTEQTVGSVGSVGSSGASEQTERIDWAASCRLALVVSIVAAFVAIGLVSLVGETTAIVMIIVAATATSWFHLEQGQLTRPATVRRDGRN